MLYDSAATQKDSQQHINNSNTDAKAITEVVMMEVDGENQQVEDRIYSPFNDMNQQIWSRIQQLFTASETTELASNAGN